MTQSTPLTTAQARGMRSRSAILDAAERLMGENGYSATSMSTLAKESGLPVSSIYWHFVSKSGLLAAVLERGGRRFLSSATPPDLNCPPDPLHRLRKMMEQCVASMQQNATFLRLFVSIMLTATDKRDDNEAIAGVRGQARKLLGKGFVWAYAEWGEQTAEYVSESLTGTAATFLDGIFLACQAGEETTGLIDRATTTLHAAAEVIRSTGSAIHGRPPRPVGPTAAQAEGDRPAD